MYNIWRKTNILLCLCVLFAAFSAAPVSWGAGLVKKGEVKAEDAYNPKPDASDLDLPMPCGLSMTFRAVGVPVSGYLSDLELLFGCDDCERPGLEFYERQYPQGISGPFRLRDLPEAWQKILAASGEAAKLEHKALYLIGKYEVSNQQWQAVMEGECPQTGPESARPKGTVSWFDAMEFSRKYMAWLLHEHTGALPRFAGDDKNLGYVRLPTEKEWEYAARGGHKVTTDSLRNENLFERDKTLPITEYAVFVPEGSAQAASAPQNIGSRLPNPLGLHDTAGNVAEMVLDPFFFSAGGRLVGAAGGFVRKGGSFLTGHGEILPGRREECAFYVQSGENKARDLGFRLVLSAINVPTQERLDAVKAEWEKSGKALPVGEKPSTQLADDVDRLLKNADAEQKRMLAELQKAMKDRNIALTRQMEQMARLQVKSAVYMVDSIRNLFIRRKPLKNQLAELEAKLKTSPTDASIADSIKKHKEYIRLFDAAISANVGHYKILVEESKQFPKELFDREVQFVAEEIALPAKDTAAQWQADTMRKCFERYARHLGWYRTGNAKQFSLENLRNDMVSEEYL